MVFTLKKLIVAIRALSVTDFRQIAAVVSARCTSCEEDVVVRDRASSVCRCPRCHSGIFAKWGKGRQGLQRFRCKACGTTFNGFTGTRFAYMKKREKLLAHARCMVEGFSIRRTAKVLGIHSSTAFSWRHRCLTRPEQLNPDLLGGIVEADETYFLQSFKGQRHDLPRKPKKRGTPAEKRGLSKEHVPVLTAQSRSVTAVLSGVLASRKYQDIDAFLAPHLTPDVLLMTDGLSAYRKMSVVHDFAYRVVPAHPQKKTHGLLHLNNINAYHNRLKSWIARFRGVATKYLSNYLGWHRMLDAARQSMTPELFLAVSWD